MERVITDVLQRIQEKDAREAAARRVCEAVWHVYHSPEAIAAHRLCGPYLRGPFPTPEALFRCAWNFEKQQFDTCWICAGPTMGIVDAIHGVVFYLESEHAKRFSRACCAVCKRGRCGCDAPGTRQKLLELLTLQYTEMQQMAGAD